MINKEVLKNYDFSKIKPTGKEGEMFEYPSDNTRELYQKMAEHYIIADIEQFGEAVRFYMDTYRRSHDYKECFLFYFQPEQELTQLFINIHSEYLRRGDDAPTEFCDYVLNEIDDVQHGIDAGDLSICENCGSIHVISDLFKRGKGGYVCRYCLKKILSEGGE